MTRLREKTSPEQQRALVAFKDAVKAKKEGEDISMEQLKDLAKAAGVSEFFEQVSTKKGGQAALKRSDGKEDLTLSELRAEPEVAETLKDVEENPQDTNPKNAKNDPVPAPPEAKKQKRAAPVEADALEEKPLKPSKEAKQPKESADPVPPKGKKQKEPDPVPAPKPSKEAKQPKESAEPAVPPKGKKQKEPEVPAPKTSKKVKPVDADVEEMPKRPQKEDGGGKASGSKDRPLRQLSLHDMKSAVWTTRTPHGQEKAVKPKQKDEAAVSDPESTAFKRYAY